MESSIKLIKTDNDEFLKEIKECLAWAKTVNISVAYASYEAFKLYEEDIKNFLRKNGKIRVIFDIEKILTDKEVIEEFATMPGDSECKVFLKTDQGKEGNFHPKFYLFYDNEKYSVFVGSSNFTLGGLKKNIECNLLVQGELKDNLFNQLREYFLFLWNHKFSLNVSNYNDLIEEYYQTFKKYQEAEKATFEPLLKNLESKKDSIIKAKNEIINENFAYLLGLASANSEFDIKNRILKIKLHRGIANKDKEYEGFYYNPEISDYKISQYEAHKIDCERIEEKLKELIITMDSKDEVGFKYTGTQYHFDIEIKFSENSPIFNKLKEIVPDDGNIKPFVPKEVINSMDRKIIISFLKGYLDLKSRISVSDGIYTTDAGGKRIFTSLRMGISISHNHPEMLEKIKNLFEKIDIKEGITFSDPSKRDREYLIRINVENIPDELIGTHWRRIFLSDFKDYMNKRKSEKIISDETNLF